VEETATSDENINRSLFYRERGRSMIPDPLRKEGPLNHLIAVTLLVLALVSAPSGAAPAQGEGLEQLLRQGRYVEALPAAESALADAELRYGRESRGVLPALDTAATLYRLLWKGPQAEGALKLSLAVRRTGGRGDTLETARCYHDLALLYYAQGRIGGSSEAMDVASLYCARWHYARAMALFRCALKLRTALAGPEDPAVAETMNAMGELYRARTEYSRAEELLTGALEIRERVLGKEDVFTAESLNSLAKLMTARLQFTQAEPLFQRALAIRRKVLGDGHPLTAESQNDLAELYLAMTDFKNAEPLLRAALAVRERALGAGHPDTALTVGNLAELYRSVGRYGEAESCLRRLIALREMLFGPDSSAAASALVSCAEVLEAEKKPAEAMALYRRALASWECLLGPDDHYIAVLLEEMIRLAGKAGMSEDAKSLQERLKAVKEAGSK